MAVYVWSLGNPWPAPSKLNTIVKQGYRKLHIVNCTFFQDGDDGDEGNVQVRHALSSSFIYIKD